MGHMRSGSTLLLHILLTHPGLISCGERNAAYHSAEDLDKLVITSRLAQRTPFSRVRYAVDQINHGRFTPNTGVFKDGRVRVIFLIRQPRATIASIVELTRCFYGAAWTVEHAADYYSERLRELAALAAELKSGRAISVDYDSLVHDTAPTLKRIEAFLDLEDPLRENYPVQRFTGKRGDPSQNIRAGRILKEVIEPSIEIPPAELQKATDAYRACRAATDVLAI
jgi:hypothetical protein